MRAGSSTNLEIDATTKMSDLHRGIDKKNRIMYLLPPPGDTTNVN